MHFLDGETASHAVAGHAGFLAVGRGHRIDVSFRRLFCVAGDTCAGDRLQRFDAAIRLWN